MSFRLKTIVGIAVIEAVLLAILVGSMLSYLRTSNEDELQKRAVVAADLFAGLAKDAVLSTDVATLESFVSQLTATPGMEYVRVRDARNRVLAESGPGAVLARPFSADVSVADATDGIFDTVVDVTEGGRVFGRVELGLSVRGIEGLMTDAGRATTMIAVTEMVLVALFSFVLGLYLTHQLKGLKIASDKVAEGEFGYQIAVRGNDELARTAQAFNRMSARLQEVYERLSLSEARHRTVLETVIDAVVTIDGKGIVSAVNPATEKMFGYSAEELIGSNVSLLVPEPHHMRHDEYIANYMKTGRQKIIGRVREVMGRRKDGSEFPMELSIGETCLDGEYMFSGVMRDITERKKMDVLKAEFVSTVSHELRTPLTAIHASIGLLSSGNLPDPAADGKRLMDIVHNNTERLVHLVNDILDIERLESGRMEFRFENAELSEILQQAFESNVGYAEKQGTRLSIGPLPEVSVRVDPGRITQVLMNLLSNAIKFSPSGGQIRIGAELLDDRVKVTVSDEGIGIPESFRLRVFERFAQAEASDSRQKGGTGLGLSICKAIIDRHGGTIGYDARAGGGTDFWFELDRFVTVGRAVTPPRLAAAI